MSDRLAVRTPASSANLGAGFDVFAMALDLFADVGEGPAPDGAQQVDEHHPARTAFERLGGTGPVWLRTNIPMGRGLGFSGAVRVGAASLAALQSGRSIADAAREILSLATELEGHGDNVAASLHGGVVAFVEDRSVPFVLGPTMGASAFVAWVPDVTTSTDRSRQTLDALVSRDHAVHNIGRAVQFALAFAHDDPGLLTDATNDRLHQDARVPHVPNAGEALAAGVHAGAWCSWLSGSGPTVGFLAPASIAAEVAAALPPGGHAKVLRIDTLGARSIDPGSGLA
ncbi:MAG: homoserine kinase [Ilumatobacter sp.]